MKKIWAAAALSCSALSTGAQAKDLFTVSGTLNNGGPTFAFEQGFDNARDVLTFIDSDNFRNNVNTYIDDFSQLDASIAFRGVPINLSFGLNNQTVNYAIPLLGEAGSFTGFDRDDSLEQLGDFLLLNSSDFLRRFQRALIKASPNDPTAGNPNSLQSQMIGNDFAAGGFDTMNTTSIVQSDTGNKLFIGLSGGTFRAQGVKGTTATMPLSYTIRYDADPRYQLQFAMPLTYMSQSGALTGAASIGAGFQFPLTAPAARNQWFITPRVTIGATGSVDAAAASILANASLTSRYVLDAGSIGGFIIANMIAYNFSVPFEVGDVRGDYQIKNVSFKNGIMYQKPLDFVLFGGHATTVQASYAMTNFIGTDLYMEKYHEAGFAVGTANDGSASSLLRLGVQSTFGRNFKKYAVTFGYTF